MRQISILSIVLLIAPLVFISGDDLPEVPIELMHKSSKDSSKSASKRSKERYNDEKWIKIIDALGNIPTISPVIFQPIAQPVVTQSPIQPPMQPTNKPKSTTNKPTNNKKQNIPTIKPSGKQQNDKPTTNKPNNNNNNKNSPTNKPNNNNNNKNSPTNKPNNNNNNKNKNGPTNKPNNNQKKNPTKKPTNKNNNNTPFTQGGRVIEPYFPSEIEQEEILLEQDLYCTTAYHETSKSLGSCIQNHKKGGCSNTDCEKLICTTIGDSFCCDVSWDENCAESAKVFCAQTELVYPKNNNCYSFTNLDEPGCSNQSCERFVCDYNPVCCTHSWSWDCVVSAFEYCCLEDDV